MEDRAILRKALNCQDAFRTCHSTIPPFLFDWIQDRQADFNLWDACMKATSRGRFSLDYRIRERPEVIQNTCLLLERLLEALEQLAKTETTEHQTSGLGDQAGESFQAPDLTISDEDSADESVGSSLDSCQHDVEVGPYDEPKVYIETILHQLMEICDIIQEFGSKSQYQTADQNIKEEDFQDFKTYLASYLTIREAQKNSSERDNTSQSMKGTQSVDCDDGRLSGVQQRLIRANVLRLNRLAYARGKALSEEKHVRVREQSLSVATDTVPISPKSDEMDPNYGLDAITHAGKAVSTATDLTQAQWTRHFPPCPETFGEDGKVRCPFCSDTLSKNEALDRSKWRSHVAQDLLPYTCIMEICDSPEDMYLTSDELVTHLQQKHAKARWICDYCSPLPDMSSCPSFGRSSEWRRHMSEAHCGILSEAQLSFLETMSKTSDIEPLNCPICLRENDTRPACGIDEHSLQHVHDFSLLSLSWLASSGIHDDDERSIVPSMSKMPDNQGVNQQSALDALSISNMSASNVSTETRVESPSAFGQDESSTSWTGSTIAHQDVTPHSRDLMLGRSVMDPKKRVDYPTPLGSVGSGRYIDPQNQSGVPTSEGSKSWIHCGAESAIGRQHEYHEYLSEDSVFLGSIKLVQQRAIAYPTHSPSNNIPSSLAKRLWQCAVKHAVKGVRPFWPPPLWADLVTQESIVAELLRLPNKAFDQKTASEFAREISSPDSECRLLVFTILLLLGTSDKLVHILRTCQYGGIRDSDLALGLEDQQLFNRKGDYIADCCSHGWSEIQLECFIDLQRRLTPPIFGLDEDDNTLVHLDIDEADILPWCSIEEHLVPVKAMSGGFGTVSKVKIHPQCHRFDKTLRAINVAGGLFAVKKLKQREREVFDKEVEALSRFNGKVHRHLVTLLATFTQGGFYHMIFPWAEHDLDEYWESFPSPDLADVGLIRWASRQCLGIMEAISLVHNPSHLASTEKFGRHGDIKAENILWYRTDNPHDRGILVVSDFSLAAINSAKSRSMMPNDSAGLKVTPSYRPPECDTLDGRITRAFDIWSLGCLYLEMVCWLLRGTLGKEAFYAARTTTFISGANVDIFFDIKRSTEDDELYVFSVKEIVSKTLSELHGEPRCSPWIHDLLDLVEQHMLLVLSSGHQRSTASYLAKRLQTMDAQTSNKGYCVKGMPQDRLSSWTKPSGVLSELNKAARSSVKQVEPRLDTYKPDGKKLHRSLRPNEWID